MIRIGWLYGDLLNMYGGRADVLVLEKVLEEEGYECEIVKYTAGDHGDIGSCDAVLCGCGTENSTIAALGDAGDLAEGIRKAVDSGKPVLMTGTSYGMALETIVDADGKEHAGLGLMPGKCIYDGKRRYSEFIMETELCSEPVIGVINTSSTYSVSGEPMFHVKSCSERILGSDSEGLRSGSLMLTELQGPVLWRNPALLDAAAAMITGKKPQAETEWRKYCRSGYENVLSVLRRSAGAK
ncbi:MAG: hypothetical protein ACOX6J_05295 [Oscillospiraceae bacterium]|jgi:CobQ-like glutamine amidotransferase family enzyme